jgi:hypothetical protein
MKTRRQLLSPSVARRLAVLCAVVFIASTSTATAAPAPTRTPTRVGFCGSAGVTCTPTATATFTPTPTHAEPPTPTPTAAVGTGSAASCNDTALNTALAVAGLVTFDCGSDPVTIDISTGTGAKTITADTTIDGGGLVTISGGDRVAQMFTVASPFRVNFTVKNLTITKGAFALDCPDRGGLPCQITGSIANGLYGSLIVTNSTFTGNGGFGIANGGTLTVTNSTFADNLGGISNTIGTLAVTNSTFISNTDGGFDGGGIFNGNGAGTLTVTNSTFIGNSGGITNAGNATAWLRNTVLASNTSSEGGQNCAGVTDGGHNLDDGTSCGFSTANGSQSNTDPQFDPAGLQDNGGPTETVALCTGAGVPAGCTAASPAWGTGDQSLCTVAPVNNVDQRGLARAQGCPPFRCSIGAYEPFATTPICAGDCDQNGHVTVDELIKGVNIVLGATAVTVDGCWEFICDDGSPDVHCLVRAVGEALDDVCIAILPIIFEGCPGIG